MARTWEQEKAYCQRRSAHLADEMEAAIEAGDSDRFKAAYGSALRYMSKKQRHPLYIKFLERNVNS